jgi:hypothetical protein
LALSYSGRYIEEEPVQLVLDFYPKLATETAIYEILSLFNDSKPHSLDEVEAFIGKNENLADKFYLYSRLLTDRKYLMLELNTDPEYHDIIPVCRRYTYRLTTFGLWTRHVLGQSAFNDICDWYSLQGK